MLLWLDTDKSVSRKQTTTNICRLNNYRVNRHKDSKNACALVHTHKPSFTHTQSQQWGALRIKEVDFTLSTPTHGAPNRDPKDTPTKMLSDRKKGKKGSKRKTEWHLVKEETACLYYFLLLAAEAERKILVSFCLLLIMANYKARPPGLITRQPKNPLWVCLWDQSAHYGG